jgi:glycosyltransferase involved in cell wall biosynthesis
LFFGRIARYKGLEDLLLALAEVAETTSLTLTVAGECFEPVLSARIEALALRLPTRVSLRLERVPDDGVESLFHDHDVMILPYREATTSGAAILASEMAIPIVISDLPAFTDIPAIRRPPGVASLATVLRELEMMDRESLERFGAAARDWSEQRITWADVAEQTHRAFASLLDPRSDASTGPR